MFLFVGLEITGTGASSPDEVATAADNPRSPSDINSAVPPNDQQEQHYQNYQKRSAGTASAVTEDSGALCEMRRTPPQNKGEGRGYAKNF